MRGKTPWRASPPIAGEEEARRRLAREIHDDFGPRMSALALALKAVWKALPADYPQRDELDAIGGSLAGLGEDLRQLSHDLYPAALERYGLAEALRDHCEEIERRHGLPVRLSLSGAPGTFPPSIALGFYRIAQEALVNAVRHSGATTVQLTLTFTESAVHLVLTDDGWGFDPGEARLAGGVGLASIEERAQSLGCQCHITSAPGAGTQIDVTWLLPAAATRDPSRGLARRHRGLATVVVLVIVVFGAGFVTALIRTRRIRETTPF